MSTCTNTSCTRDCEIPDQLVDIAAIAPRYDSMPSRFHFFETRFAQHVIESPLPLHQTLVRVCSSTQRRSADFNRCFAHVTKLRST